jgi:integrase
VQRATPEEAEGEINALSPAEVRDLLDNASEDLRPMYAAAVYAGLRRGELSGLQWRDLDLDEGLVTVRRTYARPRVKNGKVEVVGLPAELVPILRRWRVDWGRVNGCERQPGDVDWVFPVPGSLDEQGTPRMRNRGSHYTFAQDIEKATNGRVRRLHDLRHTSATLHLWLVRVRSRCSASFATPASRSRSSTSS